MPGESGRAACCACEPAPSIPWRVERACCAPGGRLHRRCIANLDPRGLTQHRYITASVGVDLIVAHRDRRSRPGHQRKVVRGFHPCMPRAVSDRLVRRWVRRGWHREQLLEIRRPQPSVPAPRIRHRAATRLVRTPAPYGGTSQRRPSACCRGVVRPCRVGRTSDQWRLHGRWGLHSGSSSPGEAPRRRRDGAREYDQPEHSLQRVSWRRNRVPSQGQCTVGAVT